MLTIEKLQELCRAARFYFDEAIIAGGAPRDITHGAEVKDIDIFVLLNEEEPTRFAECCQRFANSIGGGLKLRQNSPDYPDIFDLADITNCEVHGLIQIIGLYDDPIDDVVKYDFTVSQTFVTPAGVFQTPECGHDGRDRIIRFTPSSNDKYAMLRSKERLKRLRTKYPEPDWAYVNCEVLDAFLPNIDEMDAGKF